MGSVTIEKAGEVIAHHNKNKAERERGKPPWSIKEPNPAPGKIMWKHDGKKLELNALGVVDGWLVVEQPEGYLNGIIWRDGLYYADLIVNTKNSHPVRELTIKEVGNGGYRVKGTEPQGKLGSVLP